MIFKKWTLLVLISISVFYFCLPCAAEEQDSKRLFDILPNDSVLAVSIPDFPKLVERALDSRLGKIISDEEFAPVISDIIDFYARQIREGKQDPDVRQLLEALAVLGLNEKDLLNALQGELTFILFNIGIMPAGNAVDFAVAAELSPKIAEVLNSPRAIVDLVGAEAFPTENPFEKTEMDDGTVVHTFKIPELEMMQMEPSWVVIDNLFIFSNHMESLQKLLGELKAETLPSDLFSKSPASRAVCNALDGEPAVLLRISKERLNPFLPMIMAGAETEMVQAITSSEVRDIVWGMGVDKNGLVRETIYCGGLTESSMVTRPIPSRKEVGPPNGSVAWLCMNPDLAKFLSPEHLSLLTGHSKEEVLEAFTEIEEETGISVENDLIPAFQGTVAAFVATPFNAKGHAVHFIPDLVLKAKVKDMPAAERILKAIVEAGGGGSGLRPLEDNRYNGISYRRYRGRFDDTEPTFVLHDGWLYFGLYPQSVLRAMQNDRPGPKPMNLADEGLSGLESDDTHFILTVDLVTVIQTLYNVADFAMHMDHAYPAVDFARMPTEDKLAKFFGPLVVIGNRKTDESQVTMVSPFGFVPGIALGFLVGNWYDEREDDVRHASSKEKASEDVGSAADMSAYPDWVTVEQNTYLKDDGTLMIYAVGVAAAGKNPVQRWHTAKTNGITNICRILNTHVRFLVAGYAREAGSYYDEATLAALAVDEVLTRTVAESFVSGAIVVNKFLTSDKKEAYVLMRLDLPDLLFETLKERVKAGIKEKYDTKPGHDEEEALKQMEEAIAGLKQMLSKSPKVPVSGL